MTRSERRQETTNLWLLWTSSGLAFILGVNLLSFPSVHQGKLWGVVLASSLLTCYELMRLHRRTNFARTFACWALGAVFCLLSLPFGVGFLTGMRIFSDWTKPALMVGGWATIAALMWVGAFYVTGDERFEKAFSDSKRPE